jgi:hypothetical protein
MISLNASSLCEIKGNGVACGLIVITRTLMAAGVSREEFMIEIESNNVVGVLCGLETMVIICLNGEGVVLSLSNIELGLVGRSISIIRRENEVFVAGFKVVDCLRSDIEFALVVAIFNFWPNSKNGIIPSCDTPLCKLYAP